MMAKLHMEGIEGMTHLRKWGEKINSVWFSLKNNGGLNSSLIHQQDADELKNKEKMKQRSKDGFFSSLLWSFKEQLICEVACH